jgi:hypothetical protein
VPKRAAPRSACSLSRILWVARGLPLVPAMRIAQWGVQRGRLGAVPLVGTGTLAVERNRRKAHDARMARANGGARRRIRSPPSGHPAPAVELTRGRHGLILHPSCALEKRNGHASDDDEAA